MSALVKYGRAPSGLAIHDLLFMEALRAYCFYFKDYILLIFSKGFGAHWSKSTVWIDGLFRPDPTQLCEVYFDRALFKKKLALRSRYLLNETVIVLFCFVTWYNDILSLLWAKFGKRATALSRSSACLPGGQAKAFSNFAQR